MRDCLLWHSNEGGFCKRKTESKHPKEELKEIGIKKSSSFYFF